MCGAFAKNYLERIDYVVVNDAGEKGVEIENFGGLLELLESQ